MSLEIEAKLKVDDHGPIRDRLAGLGGRYVGRVMEANRIFDSADRQLLAGDRGLRVRTCRVEDGSRVEVTLTYKGPCQETAYKSRQQLETVVADDEAVVGILKALGFGEVVHFQKRRETWQFGPCTVELDEVPHLGCYVEIEGPSEQAVGHVQEQLGLGHLAHEPESYIALLVAHCGRCNLPTVPILFETD
jgi:adenylate cyclase, class 2